MKPISYEQEMENTELIFTPEPHRVLFSFNLGNWAIMTVITSCQNGALPQPGEETLNWKYS